MQALAASSRATGATLAPIGDPGDLPLAAGVVRRHPHRVRIYLDTSVPSAYFDERTPERRGLTVAFFTTLGEHDVTISDRVIDEIAATPTPRLGPSS